MGTDNRYMAFQRLIKIADEKGYILFDDIMEASEKCNLPLQDVDWLSNSITTRGILVYDTAPATTQINEDDDFNDFAQSNYDAVFDKVIEIAPVLEHFITDIRNIKPPQTREMEQLKYQVQEGNLYARDRVIKMHLRQAVRIALQRVKQYNCDMADTLQDACVGLINAVDKYDPDYSGAIASYSALWILQNISRAQGTQRPTVYYPVHKKEEYYVVFPVLKQRGCVTCEKVWNCQNVQKLIKEKLNCTEDHVNDILDQSIPLISLEETHEIFLKNIDIYERSGFFSGDTYFEAFCYNSTSKVEQWLLQEDVKKIISKLKPREQQIIKARYGIENGEEKTLEEVGQIFGVTRERIRQIEAKAIKKLKRLKRLKEVIQ